MSQIPCYIGTTSAQFPLHGMSPVKGFIDEFIKKVLSEFEYDKVKHTYTFICDYVIRDENTHNVIIPVNFLPILEQFLETHGYPKVFQHIPLDPINPREMTIKPNPEWKPREHQVPLINYLVRDPRPRKGISLSTGSGKLQPLDAPIKIPNGWTTMGALNVGDSVIGSDGKPYSVTAIYPHKNKQLYKVTFYDGRWTEAGAEHLWTLRYWGTENGTPTLKYKTVNTLQLQAIVEATRSVRSSRAYVDLITPEVGEDIDLPLDPYMIGALIANGGFTTSQIKFTTPDYNVVEYMKELLPPNHFIAKCVPNDCDWSIRVPHGQPNLVRDKLKELGLFGHKAPTKFIPEIYLKGSYRQKVELMQGLMDGDGTIGIGKPRKNSSGDTTTGMGSLSYSTSSTVLADQIVKLVRSFGDMASLSLRWTKYTDKFEDRVPANYQENRIHIRAHKPSIYFKSPRKKDLTNDNYQYGKYLKLPAIDVSPSRIADARCITVDSPDHLYVTQDYILTHNTFIANRSLSEIGYVSMIVTDIGIAQWTKNVSEQTSIGDNFTYLDDKKFNTPYKWVKEINAQAKTKGSKLWVLMGSDSFYQLVNDKVMPDVFICSTATLREFANGGDSYKNLPWNYQGFLKAYGIGTKIVDEAHRNFHAINYIDLLSNIKNNIFLSATFMKNGIAASRIFNIVYPQEIQKGNSDIDQYTNVTVYAYNGGVPGHAVIRRRGYNAIKYEQYLLKRPTRLKSYLDGVILPEVYCHFVRKRNPGEKCLIFFATKAMVMEAKDFLNRELAKYKVTCHEKIAGVPNDIFNDPSIDIYIGTPTGCSTGLDIAHLRTAINCVSIDSKILIKQMYGRLRRIPGVDTEWVDNVDRMIDSQVRHYYTRDRFYRKAAKTYHKVKLN